MTPNILSTGSYGDAITGSGKEEKMDLIIALLVVVILVIVVARLI